MKKYFVILLTFCLMLSIAFSASAAPLAVEDYEARTDADKANMINGIIPENVTTAYLETENPISGSKSYAFTFSAADSQNSTSGDIYLKPFGLAAGQTTVNWSGYDYIGFKVRNTDEYSYVSMMFLIDQLAKTPEGEDKYARLSPATSSYCIMRDKDNNEVDVEFADGFIVIPEQFDGTIYLPITIADDIEIVPSHDSGYSINLDTAKFENVVEMVVRFGSPEGDFEGTIMFDDVALYKEADIPGAVAPTEEPTESPTQEPSAEPSTEPSAKPSVEPSKAPASPAASASKAPAETQTTTENPSSNTGLIIGIVAAVVVIAAVVVFFIIKGKKKAN